MSVSLFLSVQALAVPPVMEYQGRILQNDGAPLSYSHVSFIFEVVDPGDSCVIYQEQVSNVNIPKGLFDVRWGVSHSFPADPLFTVHDAFDNSKNQSCLDGSAYTPASTDTRMLRVQFHDGGAWRQITPNIVIGSVPYAGFSLLAEKSQDTDRLGGQDAASYVRKAEVNGNVTCGGGDFLTWNATTRAFGCATPAGGGGPTTLSGDVSGSTSATSVDGLKGKSIVPAAYAAGQALRYNGTSWVNALLDISTDVTGTLPVSRGGTGATSQSTAINALLPAQTGNTNKILQTDGTQVSWADAMATLDFTGVNTATSGLVIKDATGKFYNFACSTSGHVPTWGATGFSCQAPSLTESDPKVGSNTTNVLSKWDGTQLVASGVFADNGNVGIGTMTPGSTLHIEKNQDGNTSIDIINTSSGGAAEAGISFYNNVGIAGYLWAPSSNFAADHLARNRFILSSSPNAEGLSLGSSGMGDVQIFTGTVGAVRLQVDSGGRVGIGTDSAKSQLHVETPLPLGTIATSGGSVTGTGTNFTTVFTVGDQITAAGQVREITNIVSDTSLTVDSAFTSNLSAGTKYFRTGAIFNAGNVGIGTTAPLAPLDISGQFIFSPVTGDHTDLAHNMIWSSAAGAWVSRSGGPGSHIQMGGGSSNISWISFLVTSAVPGTSAGTALTMKEALKIDNNGRIGVGNSSPTYALDVVGDTYTSGYFRSPNGSIQTSDIRFKKDIEPIENALEKVISLRGVTYNWKKAEFPQQAFTDRRQMGVIAQEVEDAFPEAVVTDEQGSKAVNYSALVAPLINAIKKLYARLVRVERAVEGVHRKLASVEVQKGNESELAEIQVLKKKNAELEERLRRLEHILETK